MEGVGILEQLPLRVSSLVNRYGELVDRQERKRLTDPGVCHGDSVQAVFHRRATHFAIIVKPTRISQQRCFIPVEWLNSISSTEISPLLPESVGKAPCIASPEFQHNNGYRLTTL